MNYEKLLEKIILEVYESISSIEAIAHILEIQ